MGFLGQFVEHPPLSLLYVSAYLVQEGYEVTIIDNRIEGQDWTQTLSEALSDDVVLVGCTVMTGTPLVDARDASKIAQMRGLPVVWGGGHPTVLSDQTLTESYVDFVIRGYGAAALLELVRHLSGEGDHPLEGIAGLSFSTADGRRVHNPTSRQLEVIDWQMIPYHLIEDYTVYHQLDHKEVVFPIYSAYGCPYQCSFCISPVRYQHIKKKWHPLSACDVVDHIEYLVKEFGATYIYFYDEDSFVKLQHVVDVIDEIKRRDVRVKLGFRGARISEIRQMDGAFLDRLAEAGTDVLHIGLESGSQRMLDLFQKKTTVDDIRAVNRLLCQNDEVMAVFNWIVGSPTETLRDLKETKELILEIVRDNPRAIILRPNLFQPLPGTPLFDLAIKEGYQQPLDLSAWIGHEQNVGDYSHPWTPPDAARYIRLLYIASFFIDKKLTKVGEGRSPFLRLVKAVSTIYYPIISFRVKHDLDQLFVEYPIFKACEWLMQMLRTR